MHLIKWPLSVYTTWPEKTKKKQKKQNIESLILGQSFFLVKPPNVSKYLGNLFGLITVSFNQFNPDSVQLKLWSIINKKGKKVIIKKKVKLFVGPHKFS